MEKVFPKARQILARLHLAPRDIRFTQSKDGKTIYAIVLAFPENKEVTIQSLADNSPYGNNYIKSVHMLGVRGKLKYNRDAKGLHVTLPDKKPCDVAFVLKISLKPGETAKRIPTYLLPDKELMESAEQIPYKATPQGEFSLYVLRPNGKSTHPLPAIVYFTGGGWVNGTPDGMIANAAWWRDQGIIGITADYRVKSRHGTTPMECVKDGKSAIRYVRDPRSRFGSGSRPDHCCWRPGLAVMWPPPPNFRAMTIPMKICRSVQNPTRWCYTIPLWEWDLERTFFPPTPTARR